MTDAPFPDGGAPPAGPRFEDAVRNAVEGLQESIAEWQRALKVIDAKIAYYAQWIENGTRPPSGKHEP